MPKSHRLYPPAFRQRMVELVRRGRVPISGLMAEIEAIHRVSRGTYRVRKIYTELRALGVHVWRKRVAR